MVVTDCEVPKVSWCGRRVGRRSRPLGRSRAERPPVIGWSHRIWCDYSWLRSRQPRLSNMNNRTVWDFRNMPLEHYMIS